MTIPEEVIEEAKIRDRYTSFLKWINACPRNTEQLTHEYGDYLAICVPLPDELAEARGFGRAWWHDGKRHRDDGPAVVYADGDKEWWHRGKLHREDGPAIVCANGSCLWYRYGLLHRVNGPAIHLYPGVREWWINGRPVERFID